MIPVPFMGLNLSRWRSSIAGMRKARVLPEPVRAAPRTSLPVRRTGMDFAWTGVIVVRPISESAREVDSERSRLENGVRPDSESPDFVAIACKKFRVSSVMI